MIIKITNNLSLSNWECVHSLANSLQFRYARFSTCAIGNSLDEKWRNCPNISVTHFDFKLWYVDFWDLDMLDILYDKLNYPRSKDNLPEIMSVVDQFLQSDKLIKLLPFV